MNFRTTFILLILLVGLGVFVFVANRGSEPEKPKTDTSTETVTKGVRIFPDAKADDINKLVVAPAPGAPAGSKTLELTKSDNKWNLVQPVSWPADSFDARGLVQSLLDLRSRGKVELTSENKTSTGLA